ncbi:porin family protein [Hymenobacter sp. BT730]|uniref:porin family protein n=1 Tax=Hymenobacter sp. BT730 TaxID=3063332 RepID=UPI0026DEA1C9|nr:porin family protein [Hymenobacter sp. BT730]
MKKAVFLLATVLCTTGAVQAQKTVFGIKAGANLSNIAGSDAPDANKLKPGGLAGVLVNFPASSDGFLSIQPELLYSMKGTTRNEGTFKTTLHYLDVPVLARLDLQGPFLVLGPQANILLTSNSGRDGYRPVNFGGTAGVGFQSETGLSVELRYNRDITSLNEDNGNITLHNYNSVLQAQVGYLFLGSNNPAFNHARRNRSKY